MHKVDKIKLLVNRLIELYKIEVFFPETSYQEKMMVDIIKHEAREKYDLDLNVVEIGWVKFEIHGLEKIKNKV